MFIFENKMSWLNINLFVRIYDDFVPIECC